MPMPTSPTLKRFFTHLETCGGCTGPRNLEECHFAIVCASVESLARKGMIHSAESLDSSIILMPDWGVPTAGSGPGTADAGATSSPGPCTVD